LFLLDLLFHCYWWGRIPLPGHGIAPNTISTSLSPVKFKLRIGPAVVNKVNKQMFPLMEAGLLFLASLYFQQDLVGRISET
jgi:hypothetical protein